MLFYRFVILDNKSTAFVAQRHGARNNESGSERAANRVDAKAFLQSE